MKINIEINIPDHITDARALEIIHDGLQTYIGDYETSNAADMAEENAVLEGLATAVAMEGYHRKRLQEIGVKI